MILKAYFSNFSLLFKRLTTKPALIIVLTSLLGACITTPKKTVVEPVKETPKPVVSLPSAEPIVAVSRKEVLFAQSALKKLGYRIKSIDGLWGPRSAQAMRNFEQANNVESANGRISQLNLFMLEKKSGIRISDLHQTKKVKKQKPTGLTAQLGTNTDFNSGPKLVIANQNYKLFSQPSTNSSKAKLVTKGTGLFVIGRKKGWYKVESEDKSLGYIQAR